MPSKTFRTLYQHSVAEFEGEGQKGREGAYLAIRVNAAWKGLGKPVQCDGVENVFERRRVVGPFDELLANPRMEFIFSESVKSQTTLLMQKYLPGQQSNGA